MTGSGTAGFEAVGDLARLVELSGGDPWVRWGVAPEHPPAAWHHPASGIVAVRRTRVPYRTSLFLLPPGPARPGDGPGAPTGPVGDGFSEVVARALELVPAGVPGSLTAPRAVSDAVLAAFTPAGEGTGWDWMWTADEPPPVPGEAEVADLDGGDPSAVAELTALLGAHSPRHSASPGTADARGWVGVRRQGALVACAAWLEEVPGVPLLASVAVHPRARRQGLAAAMTAAVTRRALAAGAPAVTVDLYADNDAARRVYRRLGFRLAHEFVSWPR